MAKNPIQRALGQADAITAGNRQLENLTATGSAGPGPLFNDRRTPDNSNKLKLARQVLASHQAKLATAADKDSVRRSIDATKKRIKDLGG